MPPRSGQAGNGLYDPTYEHDACGVAFVARLGAPASHEVIARALWALEHLEGYDLGGLGAPITFTSTDHAGVKRGRVYQVKEGKWQPIIEWLIPPR